MEAYREHLPHPALARHVECYWTLTVASVRSENLADAILPDGCMDILFRFRGGRHQSPTAVGTMTRPLAVTQTGPMELLGVRFNPGGAIPFLKVPAHELTDRNVPLQDIWGVAASEIWNQLAEVESPVQRCQVLDRLLQVRRARTAVATDDRVLRAAELAVRAGGQVTVDRMAEESGLGARQLERRFLATVGLSPKLASRIVRFRAAVARLHADPAVPLSRVAFESGYADQPHFTREFKALAGMPPAAYRQSRSRT